MLSPLHIRPVPTRSTDRSRIATPTRGRFRSNPRPKPSLDVFVTRCRHGKARAVPRPGSDRGLVGPRASYLPPAQAAPARSDRSSHHGYSFSVLPQLVLKTKMSHQNKIHKPPGLNILLRPRSCTGKSCSTVLHPSEVCLFLQISPPLHIGLRRSYLCHLHKQHAEKALPEVLFITFRDQTAIHIGGRSAAIRGKPRTGPRSPQQVETYGQTLPNRAKPAFLTFLASLDMTTKSDRRVATGQAVRNSSTPLWLSIYGQP